MRASNIYEILNQNFCLHKRAYAATHLDRRLFCDAQFLECFECGWTLQFITGHVFHFMNFGAKNKFATYPFHVSDRTSLRLLALWLGI